MRVYSVLNNLIRLILIKKILNTFRLPLLIFYNNFIFTLKNKSHIKIWSKSLKNKSKNLRKSNILLNAGWSLGTNCIGSNPFIISLFKGNDHNFSVALCDKALPICEFNIRGNNSIPINDLDIGYTKFSNTSVCNSCSYQSNVYKKYNVNIIKYSEFISKEETKKCISFVNNLNLDIDKLRNIEFEGINIGNNSLATYKRVNVRSEFIDTKFDREVLKNCLIGSCMMKIIVEKIYSNFNFELTFLPHGFYLIQGAFAEYLRIKKINNYHYIMGIRRGTMIFSKNSFNQKELSESKSRWINYNLSDEQVEKILDYSKNKTHSKSKVDNIMLHGDDNKLSNEIISRMRENYKYIDTLFTNVSFDADIFYRSNVFSSMRDWTLKTIEYYLNSLNKKRALIVRIHPAEIITDKGKSKDPILPLLLNKYGNNNENIVFIDSKDKVSSYSLAEKSDTCLVYGSKIILELALFKKKLISCGSNLLSGLGLAHEFQSLDEYYYLLNNLEKLNNISEDKYDEILKFAHYFYFRKMTNVEFTEKSYNDKVDFNKKEIEFKNNFDKNILIKYNDLYQKLNNYEIVD